jgi:hypothetical protein
MKLMEKLSKILVIGIFVLVSCKTAQHPVITVPVNYKERVIERLVPVKVPGDSTNLKALFECNEKNQVVLRQLSEEKSKNMQSQYRFDSGWFDYSAKTNPDTVYIPGKDRIIEREVPVPYPVETKVNYITGWQYTQIYAGRFLLTILFLFGLYKLLKWKLKS